MDNELRSFLEKKKIESILVPSSKNKDYSTLKEIVDVYTTEGYSCMTGDNIRNKAYQAGILAILERLFNEIKRPINITEIGPGADACLIKMVATTSIPVHYVGIEGNPNSAKSCKRHVKNISQSSTSFKGKNFNSTFEIVNAMSNDHENKLLKQLYDKTDILLHELVGFIASREGMIRIFYDLQQQRSLQNLPPITIPSTVATLFVPTFVNSDSFKNSIKPFRKGTRRLIGYDNILLMQPFPFHDNNVNPLWPQCGLLEFFELSQITKLNLTNKMEFKSEFKNKLNQPVTINSLTCFIHVGFETPQCISRRRMINIQEEESPTFTLTQTEIQAKIQSKKTFFTTCDILPPFSFGWANVILFFKPITLTQHEHLFVETVCDFNYGDVPNYSFHVWGDKQKTKIETSFQFS